MLSSNLENPIMTGTILLVDESTQTDIPQHLATLFKLLESKRPTRSDILAVMVYAICLESGFCPYDSSSSFATMWSCSYHSKFVQEVAHVLPETFQNYENECIEFRLKLFGYSERVCLLLAREIGDALCVTFCLENRPGKSICLPISRYIIHHTVRMGAKCIKNTKELAFVVRDRLAMPIRNFALEVDGFPYAGLLGAPEMIRHIIYGYLNKATLQKLSHTCSILREEILLEIQK